MELGLIIVGNEILSGSVVDTNTSFLARELFARGARLLEVAVIPDDVEIIAARVWEFSSRFDLVVTTGGIGPTHDDVTYEGVARAFGRGLGLRPELVAIGTGKKWWNEAAAAKLCRVPEGAVLLPGGLIPWPPVMVENVVILPGIPSLVEAHMPALAALLPSGRFFVRTVRCWGREVDLADAAAEVAAAFRGVEVGSYPILARDGVPGHVLVKFTGLEEALVVHATERFLAGLLPSMPRDLIP
jgi:molybdenum cofactor synthesis domain-containing protein